MRKMLLSINPEHVQNILNGSKKFEFRKVQCCPDVKKIIIYATSPVMKVVGEVDIINVIVDTPEKVWELTSGISKLFFDKYYQNKEIAVAYQLGNVKQYDQPLTLADIGVGFAPQSFIYIED